MSELPVGALLDCVNYDIADDPCDYEVKQGEMSVVLSHCKEDESENSLAMTTLLSLMTGVVYVVEYGLNSRYDMMDGTYKVYEP